MNIAIGCDHAGYILKEELIRLLGELGYQIIDVGAKKMVIADDYPDYAKAIAGAISGGKAERGILICGSGVGASIAVNKFQGIRGALCADTFSAHQGVEDDDANVLCLGARVTGPSLAWEITRAFLKARFSGAPRHRRRVAKVRSFDRYR